MNHLTLQLKTRQGKDERKAGREEDKQEDSKCVIRAVELRQAQVRSPIFSSFFLGGGGRGTLPNSSFA